MRRMSRQLKGRFVVCDWCGEKKYKPPQRIKKYNFCSPEHYRLYLSSNKNKDLSKGWRHTKESKEKITQANLKRDYNVIFTKEVRQKLAESAKNKIWTPEAREKLRQANLGKKLSKETKRKIKEHGKFKSDNNQWRDMDASYQAKHMYVYRHKGKPVSCVDCGTTKEDRVIQWSNKDHRYSRNLEDYEGRCVPCHRRYDYEHGLVEPV